MAQSKAELMTSVSRDVIINDLGELKTLFLENQKDQESQPVSSEELLKDAKHSVSPNHILLDGYNPNDWQPNYSIESYDDIPENLEKRYKDIIKDVLRDIVDKRNFNQLKKPYQKAIKSLIAARIHLGMNPYNSRFRDDVYTLMYRAIHGNEESAENVIKQQFPLMKTPADRRREFNEASLNRPYKNEINAFHDGLFGKNNDVLVFPVIENLDANDGSSTIADEIQSFITWYNDEIMTDGQSLEWSPQQPNKTKLITKKGESGGPKLMKIIREHDWYLYELIEAFGGISTEGLVKKKNEKTEKTNDDTPSVTLDDIIEIRNESGLFGMFDGRISQTYELITDKLEDYRIVVSRNPFHIAEASTEQIWRSCLNLESGCYRDRLRNDAEYGSLIAYVVHKDDVMMRHPLMRRMLRLGENNDGDDLSLAFSIDRPYGVGNGSKLSMIFINTLKSFLLETTNSDKTKTHSVPGDVYVDDVRHFNPQDPFYSNDCAVSDHNRNIDFYDFKNTYFYSILEQKLANKLKKKLKRDLTDEELSRTNIQHALDARYDISHFARNFLETRAEFKHNYSDYIDQIEEKIKKISNIKKTNNDDIVKYYNEYLAREVKAIEEPLSRVRTLVDKLYEFAYASNTSEKNKNKTLTSIRRFVEDGNGIQNATDILYLTDIAKKHDIDLDCKKDEITEIYTRVYHQINDFDNKGFFNHLNPIQKYGLSIEILDCDSIEKLGYTKIPAIHETIAKKLKSFEFGVCHRINSGVGLLSGFESEDEKAVKEITKDYLKAANINLAEYTLLSFLDNNRHREKLDTYYFERYLDSIGFDGNFETLEPLLENDQAFLFFRRTADYIDGSALYWFKREIYSKDDLKEQIEPWKNGRYDRYLAFKNLIAGASSDKAFVTSLIHSSYHAVVRKGQDTSSTDIETYVNSALNDLNYEFGSIYKAVDLKQRPRNHTHGMSIQMR